MLQRKRLLQCRAKDCALLLDFDNYSTEEIGDSDGGRFENHFKSEKESTELNWNFQKDRKGGGLKPINLPWERHRGYSLSLQQHIGKI